ncbi:MAG: hypothetical protein ABFD57_08610 [Smithella sp.]
MKNNLPSTTDDSSFLKELSLCKNKAKTELELVVEKLNQDHAVINFKGRFLIMEETINPVSGYPQINFSSCTDFKNFFANQFICLPHPDNSDVTDRCYRANP